MEANNSTTSMQKPRMERCIEVALHVLTWCYIFLSPLLFKRSGEHVDWGRYWHGCILPLMVCICFYINYLVLIPRYLLAKGKIKWFILFNLLLYAVSQSVMELQGMFMAPFPMHRGPRMHHNFPPHTLFVIRGFLTFVFAMGASVALKLSLRWRESEQARAEAELGRSQAELKNLKNQINPHFLLNTLNNIYALTAFDQEKAQQAIQELSRLLRYMLYENQTERVSLNKEVDFLKSYISLMRLRIYNDVDVKVDFDFPAEENLQVAPLIFISLVENAFKHGVSSTGHSFIHISLKADKHHLVFSCKNSNTPKNETDKTPGGIGLKQVASRLELSYAGKYRWTEGLQDDGQTYSSVIELFDNTLDTKNH